MSDAEFYNLGLSGTGNLFIAYRLVEGSAGKTHTVTLGDNPACTCTGFRFRGNCKHLALTMSPSQQAAPEGSINH